MTDDLNAPPDPARPLLAYWNIPDEIIARLDPSIGIFGHWDVSTLELDIQGETGSTKREVAVLRCFGKHGAHVYMLHADAGIKVGVDLARACHGIKAKEQASRLTVVGNYPDRDVLEPE